MCGIVACWTRRPALDFLLPALRRLEYRGYDSSGVAVHSPLGSVVRLRSVGRLDALETATADYFGPALGGVGIGHTRWATHGQVTLENSHPHVDCVGDVHIVHNGIVENADQLRADLTLRGHVLSTDVDSELIAHLVEESLGEGADLPDALDKAASRLVGSWAIAAMRRGDPTVVVTATRSPLVVAVVPEGAYVASDMTALAGRAEHVQIVEDGDLVVLSEHGALWRRADGSVAPPSPVANPVDDADVALGRAADFMAKEIAEQPSATSDVLGRLADGVADGSLWRSLGLPPLRRVRFVACGTSLNGAHVFGRLLSSWDVPASVAPASEQNGVVLEADAIAIALSQSGETADVLRALDGAQGLLPVLALTNVAASTLGRRSDAIVELGVGPEIGVAATKTFSAQVVAGAAVLLSGLVDARRLSPAEAAALTGRLCEVPGQLAEADRLARAYCPAVALAASRAPGFLFVGRGAALPYAAEGALKMKELTYRWAECQPAGELKHGPIALIEDGTPVVVVDDGHPKLPGTIAEVRSRKATVIDVGGPGSALPYRQCAPDGAPWGPLASVVVMQHLVREIALLLGRDVDKPRNLAKSVTVE